MTCPKASRGTSSPRASYRRGSFQVGRDRERGQPRPWSENWLGRFEPKPTVRWAVGVVGTNRTQGRNRGRGRGRGGDTDAAANIRRCRCRYKWASRFEQGPVLRAGRRVRCKGALDAHKKKRQAGGSKPGSSLATDRVLARQIPWAPQNSPKPHKRECRVLRYQGCGDRAVVDVPFP